MTTTRKTQTVAEQIEVANRNAIGELVFALHAIATNYQALLLTHNGNPDKALSLNRAWALVEKYQKV